jgi:hypothetical protein
MIEYLRHAEDRASHCFFCQSVDNLQNHFIPAKDVYKTSETPCITLTACKTCRARVYNYRSVLTTFNDQLVFFATKRKQKIPEHDVSSSLVRISAEERDLGYVAHPETKTCECFYCWATVRSTRDLIPSKPTAKDFKVRGIECKKYVVPACTKCIGRIKPKELLHTTLEERQRHINRLREKEGQRAMRFANDAKPWQRAMYDDAGVRHVLDIDDILLTDREREAKNAWSIEQSKLTT